MNRSARAAALRRFAAWAGAALWGLLEVSALARARWAQRRLGARAPAAPGRSG